MNFNLFSVLKGLLGLYLIYKGIVGRGQLFENKFTKCDPKTYIRWMRILSCVAGVFIVTDAVLDIFGLVEMNTVPYWLVWGTGLASLGALLLFNLLATDRKAMAQAREDLIREEKEKREAEAQKASERAQRVKQEAPSAPGGSRRSGSKDFEDAVDAQGKFYE